MPRHSSLPAASSTATWKRLTSKRLRHSPAGGSRWAVRCRSCSTHTSPSALRSSLERGSAPMCSHSMLRETRRPPSPGRLSSSSPACKPPSTSRLSSPAPLDLPAGRNFSAPARPRLAGTRPGRERRGYGELREDPDRDEDRDRAQIPRGGLGDHSMGSCPTGRRREAYWEEKKNADTNG